MEDLAYLRSVGDLYFFVTGFFLGFNVAFVTVLLIKKLSKSG